MSFLASLIPAALGLGGSLFGDSQASSAASAANAAAQQDANSETAITNQQLSTDQQLLQDFSDYYQPLESGTTATQSDLLSLAQPSTLSGFANAEDYLSDPNATLSGANGIGGYTMQQLYNESQQGLDPAYSGYMLGQVQSQGEALENNVNPYLPNAAGETGDIAMDSLDATANAAAQMAAQNQAIKNQALAALQTTAGGIDQQTATNLTEGYQLADAQVPATQSLISSGEAPVSTGLNNESNASNTYAQAGSQAAANSASATANAPNPFTTLGSTLANSPWLNSLGKTNTTTLNTSLPAAAVLPTYNAYSYGS